jgi:alkylation response protein AidB-like acyl-CoA dehydrogenase
MTHDAAVLRAREIASRVLAPSAGQNDKAGRFSIEAVDSLGESGLLGLLLPVNVGGAGLGPRTFATVTATLAEADASVAMVYLGSTPKCGSGPHAHTAGDWCRPPFIHSRFQ